MGELKGANIVVNSSTADLTIRNLNITDKVGNVIKFGANINNKLILVGKNKLITFAEYESGIHVGGGLTINGDGLLDVKAQGTYGGDGNDIITGYESKDTIQINGGTYSTLTSGDDVI